MKAITIQQPWATLIALGEKRFETRSRRTHVRGAIAIHAGKTLDVEALLVPAIRNTLIKHGYTDWKQLPYGKVIAIAELKESFEVTYDRIGGAVKLKAATYSTHFNPLDNEFKFGYFDDGRHAWEMANVKQIDPVPAKGQQGWWNWEEQ